MTGPTSHIARPRNSHLNPRPWHRQLSWVFGAVFLGALFLLVEHFPDSQLGRTIEAHLSQLADPESWTP